MILTLIQSLEKNTNIVSAQQSDNMDFFLKSLTWWSLGIIFAFFMGCTLYILNLKKKGSFPLLVKILSIASHPHRICPAAKPRTATKNTVPKRPGPLISKKLRRRQKNPR